MEQPRLSDTERQAIIAAELQKAWDDLTSEEQATPCKLTKMIWKECGHQEEDPIDTPCALKSKVFRCYCKDVETETHYVLNGVDKSGKPKDICYYCEDQRDKKLKKSKVEEVRKNPPPKPEKKKTSDIEAEMEGIHKLR